MKVHIVIIAILVMLVGCNKPAKEEASSESVAESMENSLTDQEKADGWKLLFDGKTLNGWKGYMKDSIGSAWSVDEESIHLDNGQKEGFQVKSGGDIITTDEYENYELSLQWKIQPCGNSGVIFHVVESPEFEYVWNTGPEMQVLDNACHPDAKIIKHRAGDLYDLITVSEETVKPAGEWNEARLKSDHGNMTFWLNGVQTVSFTMHTPEWDALVAGSKFKDMKGFGKASKGHIALQDHGDKVWFRNIKIRELAP